MVSIGTIVARNYLPLAMTLMDSIACHEPGASRHILVTDGKGQKQVRGTRVIGPEVLFEDLEELARQAFMYDVMEFATALKPVLLSHLLKSDDSAVFLDPDCYLYSSLTSSLPPANETATAALTPHRICPPPLDGLHPEEGNFKYYGVFNLGFIQVNRHSAGLLDWWSSRLRRFASIAPASTLYTDQRWMDLAPGYFDVTVLRNPAMNLAPWNLDERRLRIDATPTVDGRPLVFAHFSGVRQNSLADHLPLALTRSDARARRDTKGLDAFEALCTEYDDAVKRNRPDEVGEPYGWSSYPDGRAISLRSRRAYRRRVIEAEAQGRPPPPVPNGERGLGRHLDPLERSRLIDSMRAGARLDAERIRAAGLRGTWTRLLESSRRSPR